MSFLKKLFNFFFGTSEEEPERVSFSKTLFLEKKYGKKSRSRHHPRR